MLVGYAVSWAFLKFVVFFENFVLQLCALEKDAVSEVDGLLEDQRNLISTLKEECGLLANRLREQRLEYKLVFECLQELVQPVFTAFVEGFCLTSCDKVLRIFCFENKLYNFLICST